MTPTERWMEHMGWADVAADTSTAPPRGGASAGASPRARGPLPPARSHRRGARSTLTIITAAALFWVAALFAVIGLALATSPDSARAVVPLALAAMFGYCVVVAIKGDE